ncbi:hypothetical protein DPMN_108320 [Dreissena polymorpha]|uniref:Uncharacterized protein n=1 Tax=Dreissena polymorpha TaxID=45954 RepID=A0A9D4K8V5_DREPO|nr:hypothetical protein DPMN_108320 [Dreissena polymorpha]
MTRHIVDETGEQETKIQFGAFSMVSMMKTLGSKWSSIKNQEQLKKQSTLL